MKQDITQSQFVLLENLAKESNSASDLAIKLEISLPYILSQLKLLEAKSFIKKEIIKKTGLAGKPKQIYSIATSTVQLNIISPNITTSKSIQNKTMKLFLQSIPQIPENKQTEFSKLYWNNSESFSKFNSMKKISETNNKVTFSLTTTSNQKDSNKIIKELNNKTTKSNNKIKFTFTTK